MNTQSQEQTQAKFTRGGGEGGILLKNIFFGEGVEPVS